MSGPLCPMVSGTIHKPGSNILSISSRHRVVDVSFGSKSYLRHPSALGLVPCAFPTLPYPMTASPPAPVSPLLRALLDVREILERARHTGDRLEIEAAIERIYAELDESE